MASLLVFVSALLVSLLVATAQPSPKGFSPSAFSKYLIDARFNQLPGSPGAAKASVAAVNLDARMGATMGATIASESDYYGYYGYDSYHEGKQVCLAEQRQRNCAQLGCKLPAVGVLLPALVVVKLLSSLARHEAPWIQHFVWHPQGNMRHLGSSGLSYGCWPLNITPPARGTLIVAVIYSAASPGHSSWPSQPNLSECLQPITQHTALTWLQPSCCLCTAGCHTDTLLVALHVDVGLLPLPAVYQPQAKIQCKAVLAPAALATTVVLATTGQAT